MFKISVLRLFNQSFNLGHISLSVLNLFFFKFNVNFYKQKGKNIVLIIIINHIVPLLININRIIFKLKLKAVFFHSKILTPENITI